MADLMDIQSRKAYKDATGGDVAGGVNGVDKGELGPKWNDTFRSANQGVSAAPVQSNASQDAHLRELMAKRGELNRGKIK